VSGERLVGEQGGALRVLVTGGAGGIGLAIARHLSARGARVHVCDIDRERLAGLPGAHPGIHASECDVADPLAVESLFRAVKAELGGLDALVNNAAITGPFGPVEEQSPAEWARAISINLVGQFHCVQRAVPLLREAGGGSIVNLSSVAGRLGYPLRTAYASSKWAIVGLTESLAMELGPDNIRVNAILPGIVENERHLRQQAAQAERLGIPVEEMHERYVRNISLRRKVSEEDVAELVAFVCSPPGRSISGQSLGVCGNVETMRR
jgi:NAD(P)-dependent dehydrogenase (short-subunit alcohol dehydrogenase family)